MTLDPAVTRSSRADLAGAKEAGAGDSLHHVVQERLPAIRLRQLLRNCPDMTQSRTDIGDELHQLVFCGVHRREIQRCLSGMFDRSADTGEKQCARLVMASILTPGLAARQYQLHQL